MKENDFKEAITLGTPAVDIERISILNRRFALIEAIEAYKKQKADGFKTSLSFIKSRLCSLFMEIQPTIKRHFNPEQYEKIKNVCLSSDDFNQIELIFWEINELLDKIKLIRIDIWKEKDDKTNEEEDNESMGL